MAQDAPPTGSTPRRGCRRVLTIGGALMLLACGGCFYRIFTTFRSPEPLEIGPETTVIEGPLLPDGRVDYVAALNERMSEGVTPGNNAVVPLVQAFGPQIIDAPHRWEYLDLLGVPDISLDGEHVIGQADWLQRDDAPGPPVTGEGELKAMDQFGAAMERPWTGREFPEVAGWLEANDAPLELIVEATGRPRFYSPLVPTGEPPLVSLPLRLQQEARSAARLLTARAMLRLGEGDIDGACDDLLACHRLSRLVGQSETLINDLVAVAISAMACQGSESLALDDRLTAEQARGFSAELETLAPLPEFSATIDVGERYATLDALQAMANGKAVGVVPGLQPLTTRAFDWNLMLRLANERFDEYVAALEQKNYPTRRDRLEQLDARVQAGAPTGMSATQLITMALVGSRQQVSRQLADVLLGLLTPAISQCSVAETRAETRLRLVRIALMLAAYRADHGAYPAALEELAPDYLAEVPLDPFLDQPFHYELTETGYRLYSVGDNVTDDGGLTYDSDPRGDDIIVETPGAELDTARDQPGESL